MSAARKLDSNLVRGKPLETILQLIQPHMLDKMGCAILLPLEISVKVDKVIARRFWQARVKECPQVGDWRTHTGHRGEPYRGDLCKCISQKTAAEVLGVSQFTISRLETHAEYHGQLKFEQLANLFTVKTALWILLGEDVKHINDSNKFWED